MSLRSKNYANFICQLCANKRVSCHIAVSASFCVNKAKRQGIVLIKKYGGEWKMNFFLALAGAGVGFIWVWSTVGLLLLPAFDGRLTVSDWQTGWLCDCSGKPVARLYDKCAYFSRISFRLLKLPPAVSEILMLLSYLFLFTSVIVAVIFVYWPLALSFWFKFNIMQIKLLICLAIKLRKYRYTYTCMRVYVYIFVFETVRSRLLSLAIFCWPT